MQYGTWLLRFCIPRINYLWIHPAVHSSPESILLELIPCRSQEHCSCQKNLPLPHSPYHRFATWAAKIENRILIMSQVIKIESNYYCKHCFILQSNSFILRFRKHIVFLQYYLLIVDWLTDWSMNKNIVNFLSLSHIHVLCFFRLCSLKDYPISCYQVKSFYSPLRNLLNVL